jgi:hypothetical protein
VASVADTLAVAQWLAGKGMHVFELDHPELAKCAGLHRPDDPCDGQRGKHPACKWSTAATTDPKKVIAMFTGNARNIGIACGPSGIVVIDEDVPGDFARFCLSVGQALPATFTVKTGKGMHYYFRRPPGVELTNNEGELRSYGVNVRGVGGYVVGPGSVHQSGTTYVPVDAEAEVLPCPPWLVAALTGKAKSDKPGQEEFWTQFDKDHSWWRDVELIHHPKRHAALVAAAGYCRKVGLSRDGATPTIRDVWRRLAKNEGDPPKTYTWEQARARLDDVYTRYEAGEPRGEDTGTGRVVRLTPASTIQPRPVRWMWQDRIPVGEQTITPGRGGIGKSTFHTWLIAKLTKGTLPGVYLGKPRACIIAAAEDSWARTIVPRLLAAGADMGMVYRADVVTETGAELTLTLPRDIGALEEELGRVGAVLLSVDPLLSVIANGLDSHKDADVRRALEPLSRLADRAGVTVLGNAHFNKSSGNDPLSLVMGSAAFGNVARAALGFARDTEADDGSCVISQVKNNLGRLDLPSLRYRIDTAFIDTAEGVAEVGALVMLGESDRSVADILRDRGQSSEERSQTDEAAEWIRDFLGGLPTQTAPAAEVYSAGEAAGFPKRTLQRARKKAAARSVKTGFGGGHSWTLLPEEPANDANGANGASPGGTGAAGAIGAYERPVCRICRGPLDPFISDTGIHPLCEETP